MLFVELFPDPLPRVGGAFPGSPGVFYGAPGFGEHSLGLFADTGDLETLTLRIGEQRELAVVVRNGVPVFDQRIAMLAVLEEGRFLAAQLFVLLAEHFVRVHELVAAGRQVESVGHFRPSITTGWYTLAPKLDMLAMAMRQQLLAFTALTVPLVLTPGIATTLVLRTSLLHGVTAGLVIAAGAALASTTYGVLSGTSTTWLLKSWPWALVVLERCGAAFLVWLGATALWRALGPEDRVPRATSRGGLWQGFLANALNPPVALFYFLVVPRFVPSGAPLFRSVMVLTTVHVVLAFTWHSTCAAGAGALSRVLASPAARRAIDLITGVVLVAFAIRMLFL